MSLAQFVLGMMFSGLLRCTAPKQRILLEVQYNHLKNKTILLLYMLLFTKQFDPDLVNMGIGAPNFLKIKK
jgi:hypothetical protein